MRNMVCLFRNRGCSLENTTQWDSAKVTDQSKKQQPLHTSSSKHEDYLIQEGEATCVGQLCNYLYNNKP